MEKGGYLDRLRFDKKLLNTFVARYLTNIRVVSLVLIIIVAFGIFGFTSLSRRLNPEVRIPIIFVSTALPGASPDDVESLITVPIEDAVESVSGVDKVTSTSRNNLSFVNVEFSSSTDVDKAKADIQSAVDTVSDLPEDATDPSVIALDFEDAPVWTFAITSKEEDTASLLRFGEILQDRIESHPDVKQAAVSGLETQEIQVLVKPEAVEEYGVSPLALSQAVRSAVGSYPAGEVSSTTTSFSLTIDPVLESVEDVRNLEVTVGGQRVRLGEIATVNERSAPQQAKSYFATDENGQKRIVTFNVFKLQSADIDKTSEVAHELVDEVLAEFDNRFEVISIMDSGADIKDQFDELFENLSVTIFLVFLTLFFFLGIKQATIASFSIPLSFLITFGTIQMLGFSLNFLTVFSLLLALGLVLDDAIVIISAMTSYYRTGKFTATETGLLVWKDFITPIWTTTITTVWAFVPLLLSSGIIGEFIKSIPIVVTTALLASTSSAVLITLPLMMLIVEPNVPKRVKILFKVLAGITIIALLWQVFAWNSLRPFIILMLAIIAVFGYKVRKDLWKGFMSLSYVKKAKEFLKKHKKEEKTLEDWFFKGIVNPRKLSRRYERLMMRILSSPRLRKKVALIVVIFFFFSILLIPLGFVKNEFFPKTDEDVVYISVELPPGTTLDVSNTEAQRLLEEFRSTEETEYVIANVGQGVQIDSTSAGQTNSNILSFTFKLKEDREVSSIVIADRLRERYGDYDSGELRVIEFSGGPPVGADIVVNLLGDELDELDSIANDIIAYMEDQPGLINVEKSVKQGMSKLSFVPDMSKLQEAGLSIDQLGLWMRTYASGFTLDEVRFTGNDTQDITFRMSSDIQSPESLASVTVPTQQGSVQLLSLGELELRTNPTQINRENSQRTLAVTASVQAGYNIPEINQKIGQHIDNEMNLPQGYEWTTGGVNEENQRSVQSILQAMVLAFILILGTMVVQLRSFRKSLIVLMVIPLAMSGVFVVFALTGIPLSFPALIGILALFGIVVNNSIVVVDKINLNLRIGMPYTESIADAASSRLEPIMFSSLTTIMGLLPITLTQPLWQGLGGAIIAGLTFSGTIMLLFIPVMYYMMFRGEY